MRKVIPAAIVLVAAIGAGVWFAMRGTGEPVAAAPAGVPAPGADLAGARPAAPAPAAAIPASGGEPGSDGAMLPAVELSPVAREIQARLDALSAAYNEGDAAAADRALGRDHAVVRPDGKTYYRSDVLAQWAQEWTQLDNRNLRMKLEFVEEEREIVNASWSVDLTADLTGPDGQVHAFEFHGSQLAHYRRDGDELFLLEPIRYTRVYQTIDGDNVNPHQ